MRHLIAAAVLFVSCIGPANASGGLWCTIDDANMKMTVESGVGHGMGGPIFNMRATAELMVKDAKDDFRKLTLDDKLVHSWIDGDETRLLFYTERQGDQPVGSIEITIETSDDREETVDLKGKYEVSYFEAERQTGDADGFVRFTGDVSCGGE